MNREGNVCKKKTVESWLPGFSGFYNTPFESNIESLEKELQERFDLADENVEE